MGGDGRRGCGGGRASDGTEHRLAQFTELVATAIANTEAREDLRHVADEQAALRRVATLVARDDAPEAAFAAVAEELGLLFRAEATGVNRYEMDGAVTSVGSWNSLGESSSPAPRATLGGYNVTTLVFDGTAGTDHRYTRTTPAPPRASHEDTDCDPPLGCPCESAAVSGVRSRWRCPTRRPCPPVLRTGSSRLRRAHRECDRQGAGARGAAARGG